MNLRELYIDSMGDLKKENDNILFENKRESRVFPIEEIKEIYLLKPINVSGQFFVMAGKQSIVLHFFDYYGNYRGSFFPRKSMESGAVLVKQVENYLNYEKRMQISKEFVTGALKNMLYLLQDHKNKIGSDAIQNIREEIKNAETSRTIEELMSAEGRGHVSFYNSLDRITETRDFKIGNRTRNPPGNPSNSMISFLHSILYPKIVSTLYLTHLDPSISFLHEPGQRRFSLSLDISEIFKPLISYRLYLSLINLKMIGDSDFRRNGDIIYISESGKKKIISEFRERLSQSIYRENLKRNVTFEELIRIECYKIEKHVLGLEKYKGLVIH